MSRPRIREVIVVEGRYDKNTLLQVVDATVVQTEGFGIFKNREKVAFLRRLAVQRGLILLTDSDGAGFVIRNHLKGLIPPQQLKEAYIPDVAGKEQRKRKPARAGKLGVEGMNTAILLESLRRCGATWEEGPSLSPRGGITKTDLFAVGLSGGPDSAKKRRALLRKLQLPEQLSANGLLEALNLLYDVEQLPELLVELA